MDYTRPSLALRIESIRKSFLDAKDRDILKFGTLGAGVGCATGPNSGDFAHIVDYNVKAGPCIGSALGAAVIKLIHK